MKRGRDIFAVHPTLTVSKIVKAFRWTGSTRKAAFLLGISHGSVNKYLKLRNVHGHVGHPEMKGKYVPAWHTSEFARWLRKHPTAKLPRSPKELAFISGCTVDCVKSYLYRRRKFERRRMAYLPDLRLLGNALMLRWREGAFTTAAIEHYTIDIDKYTFDYVVHALLRDGRVVHVIINAKELRHAVKDFQKQARGPEHCEAGPTTATTTLQPANSGTADSGGVQPSTATGDADRDPDGRRDSTADRTARGPGEVHTAPSDRG